jgi:hypothetical protein
VSTVTNPATQGSVDTTPPPTTKNRKNESTERVGIRYEKYYPDNKDYPRIIKKTSEPVPYKNVDFLIDFGMPSIGELEFSEKFEKFDGYLDAIYNKLKTNEVNRDWFEILAKEIGNYRQMLLFILNVKVTVLSNNNGANLLKEWRPDEKVPPPVTQEVEAIKHLFSKPDAQKTILEKNIDRINGFLYKRTDETEKAIFQEILYNIAMGNIGGLYKDFVKRMGG